MASVCFHHAERDEYTGSCQSSESNMQEYAEELAELRTSHPSLAARIGGFRTLEHILDWMKQDGLSFSSLDMVAQDEYCHDLLMPLEDDWLVFGMT